MVEKKGLLIGGLVIALVLSFALAMNTEAKDDESILQKMQRTGKLKVGVAHTPPACQRNKDNQQWEGINIDIVKDLGKYTNVEIEYVETTWDAFPAALNGKKFDAYVPGTFATVERALVMAFTVPAGYEGLMMGVNKDRKDEFKEWDDFNSPDVTIGVTLGTVEELRAKEFFPTANHRVIKARDSSQVGLELKSGRIDAWFTGANYIVNFIRQNKDWLHIFKNGEQIGATPIGWAVRYGDPDWLNFLNTFLEYERAQGKLDLYRRKWAPEYYEFQRSGTGKLD